jgi:hypothetical protein
MRHFPLRKGYIYVRQQCQFFKEQSYYEPTSLHIRPAYLLPSRNSSMETFPNPDVIAQNSGAYTFKAMVYHSGIPSMFPLPVITDKLWHTVFGLYV